MIRKREIFLVFALVLGGIKILYELRHIAWIGSYLSVMVSVLLIYPAYWHATARRMEIRFFEPDAASALASLKLFLILALAIFPPFLLASHFYQTLIFGLHFQPQAIDIGWNSVLTQLFLVALPEEFFFRGYLQTNLSRWINRSFRFLWIPGLSMSWGVPAAAFLFTFSHSFITFRWWHFAIFFPALAFGWLREKTNGLIAPILFHALSNLIINQIGNWYR